MERSKASSPEPIIDWAQRIPLPESIVLEPTETCNIRCRMCHVSYMPVRARPRLDPEVLECLSVLDPDHTTLILGQGFEPTLHPRFGEILDLLGRLRLPYMMTTNASLLDAETRSRLKATDLRKLTFSVDSTKEGPFEFIRRGAKFSEILENIEATIEELSGHSRPLFQVNATIVRDTVEELPEMVAFWDDRGIDYIEFLIMVIRYADPDLVRLSPYPVRHRLFELLEAAGEDVIENQRRVRLGFPRFDFSAFERRFPGHLDGDGRLSSGLPGLPRITGGAEYNRHGDFDGMPVRCRSPLAFARILPNGDVQLCHKYVVGNLHEEGLEAIWYGQRSAEVRREVRTDATVCQTCDYFRFCVTPDPPSALDQRTYFVSRLAMLVDHVDFETGKILVPVNDFYPEFLESIAGCNLIWYQNQYLVIPQSLGHVDLRALDSLSQIPEILTAESLPKARRMAVERSGADGLDESPRLIRSGDGWNLVRLRGRFLVVASSLGPIDLGRIHDPEGLEGVLGAESLEEAIRLGEQYFASSSEASPGAGLPEGMPV